MKGQLAISTSRPVKEGLIPQLLSFDLRELALEKLKIYGFPLSYREARCCLGRSFHLNRNDCRRLLIAMSEAGLIRFNMHGIIFLRGVEI